MKNLHSIDTEENDFNRLNTEQKIMRRTAEYDPPFTTTKEEARQRLQAKIEALEMNAKPHKSVLLYPKYWIPAVAAAIVLLIVGTWFFIGYNFKTY